MIEIPEEDLLYKPDCSARLFILEVWRQIRHKHYLKLLESKKTTDVSEPEKLVNIDGANKMLI